MKTSLFRRGTCFGAGVHRGCTPVGRWRNAWRGANAGDTLADYQITLARAAIDAGGRARRRPPRARALGRPLSRRAGRVGVTGRGLVGLSTVRAPGILTTWGDGEWAVVGRGLPGVAVAALRSPTGAAGCTSGAARGGRCASCRVRFGARRPRPFVVGVSAWRAEQDVKTAV